METDADLFTVTVSFPTGGEETDQRMVTGGETPMTPEEVESV